MKESYILQNAIKFNNHLKGVYFLINKNKIVYVGASKNTEKRIYFHRKKNAMRFDSYYILCLDLEMDAIFKIESMWIDKLRPKYNVRDNFNCILDKPDYFKIAIKKHKRISNLANVLGLSTTTVYAVLHSKPSVSKQSRNKVLKSLEIAEK